MLELEAQLADKDREIIVAGGITYSREAAWAATQGLRRAWTLADDEPEIAVGFDAIEKDALGEWYVVVERRQHGGHMISLDRIRLGRFPG